MKNELIIKSESIEAINKSEVEVSMEAAKNYPRDMKQAVNECLTIATMTKGTAEECFYALPRKERKPDGSFVTKFIEGPSVRLAEILAYSWGNITMGFRIIANDGQKITAMGMCLDLQRNIRVQIEVDRRITTKAGKTFNEDMQIVTGNAAGSIALRNAIFRVIPKAVISDIMDEIKKVAMGTIKDLESSRETALKHFESMGVDRKTILSTIGLNDEKEITVDHIFTLRNIGTAIKEGSSSIDDAFGLNKLENSKDQKAGDLDPDIKKDIEKTTAKINDPKSYDDFAKNIEKDLESLNDEAAKEFENQTKKPKK